MPGFDGFQWQGDSEALVKRVGNDPRTDEEGWIVEQVQERVEVAEVAACTTTAVHGRDHDHMASVQLCHPHVVEVIFLGRRALTVCHDCRVDSGFIPFREAERLAEGHRDQTREANLSLELSIAC